MVARAPGVQGRPRAARRFDRSGPGYRRFVTVDPSSSRPVRVRFAPSPSGALHLGSALVALANAALARQAGGQLVLRIDDTDAARSTQEDAMELLRLLRWLGVDWHDGPHHQSDRMPRYRQALDVLLDGGHAYACFCGDARLSQLRASQEQAGLPPRYDGRCRQLDPENSARAIADGAPHVLRFAVPSRRDVTFDDLVHGRVVVPSSAFGDPILCRADGTAGYLLASVADDVSLQITHVVRGEDHLTNTARQLLLFEALGGDVPRFAHLPLLRDQEGRKLSKRDPLGTLDELSDEGFLPTTVRRYLAELLGQGPLDLLADHAPPLELGRVPTGAPRVDRARLESLGREDMAKLDVSALLEGMGVEATGAVAPLVRELAAGAPSRVALRGELRLAFDGPGAGDLPVVLRMLAPDPLVLGTWDAALELAIAQLRIERDLATGGTGAGWADSVVRRCRDAAAATGLRARDVLQPLRIALTGTTGGPALELVLSAIGPAEALRRLQLARLVIEDLGANDAHVG